MELILWMILCGSFVYLVIYFWGLGTPSSTSAKISLNKKDDTNRLPLSVIICAHNEAENLEKNIPYVLNQSHENFEVIVVNDNSTDESKKVLKQLQTAFNHLKVIEIKEGEKQLAGKKELLAKALHEAKNETIVVTDADCYPATNNWLKIFSEYTYTGAKIVLGYSPYKSDRRQGQSSIINHQSSILNKLIRFEATQTAWQYFSNALAGKAYMGVGRNMLFHKTDYLNWFENTQHKTAGGDDDLFVNAFGNKKNIAVCLDEETFVYTEPKKTFASWLKQKTRHTQASYHYNWFDKIKLFAFALAQFGLYASGIALMFSGKGGVAVSLVFMGVWSIAQIAFSWRIYKRLRQQDLILWIPLLQPLYVFSISLIFLLSLIKRSDTWN